MGLFVLAAIRLAGLNDLVHLEPVVYKLHLYAPGGSYEARSKPLAAAMVQIVGQEAHVSCLCGSLSLAHYREFLAQLSEIGCTSMVAERHGVIKITEIT